MLMKYLSGMDDDSMQEKFYERLQERREEARIVRRIVFSISVFSLVVFGTAATIGFLYIKSALGPLDANDTTPIAVEIPLGSGSSTIGAILEEEGIISNGMVFKYYLKFGNSADDLKAGTYQLAPSMSMEEIVQKLKPTPTPNVKEE